MPSLDLDSVRNALTNEQKRITAQISKLAEQDAPNGGRSEQDPADESTELFFREQDEAIRAGLKAELGQVEAAERKLSNGTYGSCDRCGGSISPERLEALPFALYCIQCAGQV